MQTRLELILLQKTMVVVEGVARSLDPAFNMWKTSEPVIAAWIADNLGPKAMLEDARDGVSAAMRLARQAPDLAERAERLARDIDAMAANGLRFDAETAEAIGRSEARHSRSGRLALWIIAAAAVYLAWMLT
jgi:ubiquinone biosynthesis protein